MTTDIDLGNLYPMVRAPSAADYHRDVRNFLVAECKQLSDAQPDALLAFGEVLLEAHERCPGGASIEVGTRAGGSALITAKLLDFIYRSAPPFFTVDPYGHKVYQGGDHEPNDALRPYGDAFYVCAKNVLAPFGNHAHFYLESMEFFRAMLRCGFWRSGIKLPFERCASFVFLDGDHDAVSISDEVGIVATHWLRPGGTILIDNAKNDPKLPDRLRALELDLDVRFFGREWCQIRVA